MTTATSQATALSTGPLTKSPIFARSLGEVHQRERPRRRAAGSGSPGSGSAGSRRRVSPYIAVTITAGTMAMSRVMSRRSQGGRRMLRKPSITICPASVPVSVEFCPEASSATANSVLASAVPSSGVSSW